MEGRAIARPNQAQLLSIEDVAAVPSMEGRAIARPNRRRRPLRASPSSAFNGGPGNCPAKPLASTTSTTKRNAVLQWRAGQLPGQTSPNWPARSARSTFNGGPGNCPAKLVGSTRHNTASAAFNGGPGNCPAKRCGRAGKDHVDRRPSMEGRAIARPNIHCNATRVRSTSPLQWRAGQLPGQTRRQ